MSESIRSDFHTSIDLDAMRREAAESERQRVSEIVKVAQYLSLGDEFVDEHRRAGTTVENVRAAALGALEKRITEANRRCRIVKGIALVTLGELEQTVLAAIQDGSANPSTLVDRFDAARREILETAAPSQPE